VSPVSSDPVVGRRLDERYLVQETLAVGGMATVYRGIDTRLQRPVAIKVMNPALSMDAGFVARFSREAQSAASLSDPHTVAVFDQGMDDGVVYLVMEYVAGATLRDVLHRRGALPPREALDILRQLLQGLAAAHQRGLVHCDVKPENVLIRDDGLVKVSDFGLARAATAGDATQATAGLLMGTVAYLAPEQVERHVADPRSDVYSAGVLLYEMLVGGPPFEGESAWDVATQHVTGQVPAPSTVDPSVPAELDALVARATRRDPDGRPATATDFLTLVTAARRTLPETPAAANGPGVIDLTRTMVVVPDRGGRAPVHQATTVMGAPNAAGTPPTKPPSKRRRWRGPLALILIVACAIAVGAVAWWLGAGRYVGVPGVLNQTQQQAEATLAQHGLHVTYGTPQYSETVAKGKVLATDPAPGAHIQRGGTVTVTMSKGPQRFPVPNLSGSTVAQARAQLASTKLAVGNISHEYSTLVPSGKIISTSPPTGHRVPQGTPVALVVSKGLPPVAVPNVVKHSYDDAAKMLAGVGLKIAQTSQQHSMTVPKGAVISQSPTPGHMTPQGSTVNVVVSEGPPLVLVPNVIDKPIADAIATLKAAGFNYTTYKPFGISPLNRVASQDPKGGIMAPKGSVVRLGII